MVLVCHLDHDVLHPLGSDSTVQALVGGLRAKGYRIRLSPQTVYELVNAQENVRNFRIEAAIKYCDEFTHLQPIHILTMEVTAISKGSGAITIPIEPIVSLNLLRTDPGALARMKYPPADRKESIQTLNDVDRDIRSTPGLLEEARTLSFEDFCKTWYPIFLKDSLQRGLRVAGLPPLAKGAKTPPGIGAGLVMHSTLMLANIYRKFHNEIRKGEGSMSDIRGAVEAAYCQMFVTRDVELYEALLLVKTVVDGLPAVMLARLSTDPPYSPR